MWENRTFGKNKIFYINFFSLLCLFVYLPEFFVYCFVFSFHLFIAFFFGLYRFRTKKKHSRLSHKEAEKSSRSQAQPGYQVLQAATSSNEQFSARAKSQNLVISEAVSSALAFFFMNY